MAFVKVILLRLVSPRCLSDRIRGLNSTLPEFFVCSILVNLLLRDVHRHILLVLVVYTSVRVISQPVGLLPCKAVVISVNRYEVIEVRVQLFVPKNMFILHMLSSDISFQINEVAQWVE